MLDIKSEAAFLLIEAYKKLTDLPDLEIATRVAAALELNFISDLMTHHGNGQRSFAHTITLQKKDF